MNYKQVYIDIIERAKHRNNDEYTEKHHIIPKCLGGNNSKDNIIVLTYREHFICHWLLCKIYPKDHKLKAAFAKMLETSKYKKRIISSYMFDAVKRNLRDLHFDWLKGRDPWNKGKKGVQIPWNKGISTGPASEERKRKSSETLKEFYQHNTHHRKGKSSWCAGTKGIVKAWNKGLPSEKTACPHCNRMIDYMNMKKWHGDKCKLKEILQNQREVA